MSNVSDSVQCSDRENFLPPNNSKFVVEDNSNNKISQDVRNLMFFFEKKTIFFSKSVKVAICCRMRFNDIVSWKCLLSTWPNLRLRIFYPTSQIQKLKICWAARFPITNFHRKVGEILFFQTFVEFVLGDFSDINVFKRVSTFEQDSQMKFLMKLTLSSQSFLSQTIKILDAEHHPMLITKHTDFGLSYLVTVLLITFCFCFWSIFPVLPVYSHVKT